MPTTLLVLVVTITLLIAQGVNSQARANQTPIPPSTGQPVAIKLKLSHTKRVQLIDQPDGSYRYLITDTQNNTQQLTPDQFAHRLYRESTSCHWLNRLLNISHPIGIAWVALGFGGQLLFTGRMVVQWLTSEKHNRSVVPDVFWWMSLIGAVMLLIYFVWRKDIVGIAGQATGGFIYIRNLVLIHRHNHQRSAIGPCEGDLGDTMAD